MRNSCVMALLAAGAGLAFGQFESDTLTVQASRSVNLQPDQAAFYVSVASSRTTGLDEILAALQGSGVTAANFSSVYDAGGEPARLQWSFTLAVPWTKLKATLATLVTLQQSLGKSGLQMNLSIGTQFSPELLASQSCSLKDLVADARAQAQSMAASAGFAVGQIVSMADGSSQNALTAAGRFDLVPGLIVKLGYVQSIFTTPSTCFAELKFKLLRYQ